MAEQETAWRPPTNWVAALNRFLQPPKPLKRCELCSREIAAQHRHLMEQSGRRLVCACEPCALLFERPNGRYRLVPRGRRRLDNFNLGDAQWDGLDIPIDIAFFTRRGADGPVLAFYPGPAGTAQRVVAPQVWEQLQAANPVLDELESDVEALLVNRTGGERAYYRVPIDHCYVLVGLIRRHWQGMSGGSLVWQRIGEYFAWLDGGPDSLVGEAHG